MNPSTFKRKIQSNSHSLSGLKFGIDVHSMLEQVSWTDEIAVNLPITPAGKAVSNLINNPDLKHVFQKQSRPIVLLREQAVDALIDGDHLVGVIDRLHLHLNPHDEVTMVEIIDYKTDSVKESDELIDRYRAQMQAYRAALQKIYPTAEISCVLISTRHIKAITIIQDGSADIQAG
jgi:ATP-dependent exoDNAse (exonuclease V) beta subunit